ncbi:MAG TPA: cyclase family protein [Candidatus Angelobacter sp.]|jgi:kynurenine formamidase|nr:cyclase family protein [Candidatus Angelobacter sp.]
MIRWKTFAIGWSLALALLLFAQRKSATPDAIAYQQVVDLTHNLNDHSPNWDGAAQSPFSARQTESFEHDGYYARSFTTDEHYGTHLDAPAHFAAGMWTVEQIPAERLVRPMVVLNVRAKTSAHPDYEISVADIADWEGQHGEIPSGAVVMAYTGWDEHWTSPTAYRNAAADGQPHFPGYSLEAAQFLVKTRSVIGLGIDTLSIDPGVSKTFPVHQFTAKESVYQLENVANLGLVPPVGATIVVAPVKLENGSGGPARLLALVK